MGEKKSGRKKGVALLLVGMVLGAALISPAGAHVGGTVSHLWTQHIKPKVTNLVYTKAQSNARFANAVAGTDKAKNADKLDGNDSSAFAPAASGATAYGVVSTTGARLSGHGDWTVTWVDAIDWYRIDFPGITHDIGSNDIVVVTPEAWSSNGCRTAHARTDSTGGDLLVRIFDSAGTAAIQCGFEFVAYLDVAT